MKPRILSIVVVLLAGSLAAQEPANARASFNQAAASVRRQLQESVAELDKLRSDMAAEKVPLSRKLGELEAQLAQARLESQQQARLLDSRSLDLSNLRTEVKSRHDEKAYLSNLLGEYLRNFESRLHIAELQRYASTLRAAKLAAENSSLSDREVYAAQLALLAASVQRLEDALGGTAFQGKAVDAKGLVKDGTFLVVGPAAVFRSADGQDVGSAEQRLGSLEPTVIPFANPEDAVAAAQVVESKAGRLPFDPTLGNAHKIEATKETLWEHINKGGPVMVPIFALAGFALLIALYKWITLAFVRRPSPKCIAALLDAVAGDDRERASEVVESIPGPAGSMLRAGVERLGAPRELIEEVMYEKVLTTRLQLQRLLPFMSICAAAAPLLGLLGTVTGIINTFNLITVFGSQDPKMLSGGISEALITTEYGLIVAIPSLLVHAFLSRKVRSVVGQMEAVAVAFVNQMGKAAHASQQSEERARSSVAAASAAGRDELRGQVHAILREMLQPLQRRSTADAGQELMGAHDVHA